jgi:beta-hydroxylase
MHRPAFHPLHDFPKLEPLGRHWQAIREEFLALHAPVLDIDRLDKTHAEVFAELGRHLDRGGEFGWMLGWPDNPNWIQYALVLNDAPLPFVRNAFPKTLALVAQLSGIKVCGFSRILPNGFLPTHRHPELIAENLLQCHLTIDAPTEDNYCYLNVGGEFRQHTNGAMFVFDGSLDHFAVNASTAPRTILYLEFDRSRAA